MPEPTSPDSIDGEDIIAVPPAPRCLVCGHQACPCCLLMLLSWSAWCDVVLEDGELCCEGICSYRAGELEVWASQLEAVLPKRLDVILRESEGPFR